MVSNPLLRRSVNLNMKPKTIKLFLLLMVGLITSTCFPPEYPDFPVEEVEGYKPVYANDSDAAIEFQSPRSLTKPGKIYKYGTYLLVNERFEGIHLFDNTDPAHPTALGFLRVYGNIDMAVRNNILYVDHIGDLVALQISDLFQPTELSRIPTWSNDLPPHEGKYFECVDPGKGKVIGWVLATLKKPECFK
jgi:hypothetical protein